MAGGDHQLSAVSASSLAAKSNKTKRKTAPKEDEEESESDSGSDDSMINVDFDFYNLDPDVDQIAVKRLLRQTLSHDDELIDVHPLASLILSEGVRLSAGSSVKTDGEESDPWGLVAVVDIARYQNDPALKPFLDYLRSTLTAICPINLLLNPNPSPAINNRPALIFSLRMLNLPLPLMPPLYKMLLSELPNTGETDFSHWLIWGRGYRLEGSDERMGLNMNDGTDLNGISKKKKNKQNGHGNGNIAITLTAGNFPYHPEEEFIDKVASHVHRYPFRSAPSRDAEAFGVEQFGRLVLVERNRLAEAVQMMEDACA